MALQDGTFVIADPELIRAVDYALTLKYTEEPEVQGRRRRSSVNDAGLGGTVVQKHPFDAEIVNKGTAESPSYYVRIFNSSLPDSPYAGTVYVYEYQINVPVTELAISTDNGFFVALDVTLASGSNPPYSIKLSIVPFGSGGEVGYTTYREYIAEGKLPDVASRVDGDIWVYGRWV